MSEQDDKDRRIAELERENAELRSRIAELEKQVRDLLAQLGRNSLNSSLPPSRDSAEARKQRKKKTKGRRKRGGQKGHKRATRELLPADEVIDHVPEHCYRCAAGLEGEDEWPERHQVIDLPQLKGHVTEHRYHTVGCKQCGAKTTARRGDEYKHGAFGSRLSALVCLLTGSYRMSKRNVKELLSDVLGINIALGTVSKIEARATDALEAAHREVLTHIRSSPYVNMDETGWIERNAKAWLWVASTSEVAYYAVKPERSSEVVIDILGEDFTGIVGNDRARAYLALEPVQRQVCWFHLGRNFQSKIELGGEAARFGEQMRAFERRLFKAHHLWRADDITHESFLRRMKMLRGEVLSALYAWQDYDVDGVGGMCRNLLWLEPAMWTFVKHPKVEPTNNVAEQDMRHPVIWRRSSFGTDSPRGSRFVERVLTVRQSLKKQGRRVFDFFAEFLSAVREGVSPPSLLPAT